MIRSITRIFQIIIGFSLFIACSGLPAKQLTTRDSFILETIEQTAKPSSTPTASKRIGESSITAPTKTPKLISINVIVWEEDPKVPILTLHQFKPDNTSPSDFSGHKLTLGDFGSSLHLLYEADFVLISLKDWLSGDISVPVGKHPLILTMDDLFFRNQILINREGTPNPETGIGVLWGFYQEHPDFGFNLSLFAVFGDKYYPFNPNNPISEEYSGLDWEIELAHTIVWCIEHNAHIYNHTYYHGYLAGSQYSVSMNNFIDQLTLNDARLHEILNIAGREDMIPELRNIIALPGGMPPRNETDWSKLIEYRDPNGANLEGLLHIYSKITPPSRWEYLPAPYSSEFDKFNIIRIVANIPNIEYLVSNSDKFPSAQLC